MLKPMLAIAMLLTAAVPAAALSPDEQIAAIAQQWTGSFDNRRQVAATLSMGGPQTPERTTELRSVTVEPLPEGPFAGPALLLQEVRGSRPDVAHRQRVHVLRWDAEAGAVRVEQHFFKEGPTYDRKPKTVDAVAKLSAAAFDHIARCDLFLRWDPATQRFAGGMAPRACVYEHPKGGEVYAEFDMLLWPGDYWYRDRSVLTASGAPKGEIDGFGWLRFEKRASAGYTAADFARDFPALSRQFGTWRGTFRRYDAKGKLTAEFPSDISASLDFSGPAPVYRQTNSYTLPDGTAQVIRSEGLIANGRLVFDNPVVSGWAADVSDRPDELNSLIFLTYKDGSGITASEIVTLSADGKHRSRATQYLKDGRIVRRTLIDETKAE